MNTRNVDAIQLWNALLCILNDKMANGRLTREELALCQALGWDAVSGEKEFFEKQKD